MQCVNHRLSSELCVLNHHMTHIRYMNRKKKKKNQPIIKKKNAYLRRKAVGKCNHKLSYVAQIPFVLIIGSLNFEKHKS